jgi:hypothetical protein
MAGQRNGSPSAKVIRRALFLVTEAMDLLDAHGTQPDASARLAMAQQALRQASSTGMADGS